MVEHLWIRLAELREEAAHEEWEARHPRYARAHKYWRYWRAQFKCFVRWLVERQATQRIVAQASHARERAERRAILTYLVLTRCGRIQPARSLIMRLSNKELLDELDARGLERDDCVERIDLLDLLCGPTSPVARTVDTIDEGESTTTLDKMV